VGIGGCRCELPVRNAPGPLRETPQRVGLTRAAMARMFGVTDSPVSSPLMWAGAMREASGALGPLGFRTPVRRVQRGPSGEVWDRLPGASDPPERCQALTSETARAQLPQKLDIASRAIITVSQRGRRAWKMGRPRHRTDMVMAADRRRNRRISGHSTRVGLGTCRKSAATPSRCGVRAISICPCYAGKLLLHFVHLLLGEIFKVD
jgi:hypothetical protein